MKCICEAHECTPGCTCGHSIPPHRFTVRQITKYNRTCLQHGYMFNTNIAADLRYGD